jgi:undecaprenyl-diphosphatase
MNEPVKKIANAPQPVALLESEPAPVRRYRALIFRTILLIIAAAFAGLTFLVKTTPSFAVDLSITQAIQRVNFPPFETFMIWISWPGFSPQSEMIAGLLIGLIYGFGLRWEAVMTLIASLLTAGVNLLVKDLVQRPRPAAGPVNVIDILNSYSFPSGHVMFYLGVFGFIGFLAFTLLKPSIKRSLILAILNSLIVLVGVSRIYLGQHWASDVLGAYLLGSLTLVVIIEFYTWGKPRFFVHHPVSAAEPEQV